MQKVRVRYGPSPTGIPHIGNIRTALFNYLFAKNQKGEFFLRIEDTDQARLVPESIQKIKESLILLGLNWDGEIIYQSNRLPLYNKHLETLKKENYAYSDNGAWKFKIPQKNRKISWTDIVHGDVSYPDNVLEDFVIVKSDGFPTYHFASVVDDHEMEISHVFRGDEWIPSTPKHILLYEALGWKAPQFVHLPPIIGHDKKKLSKREGAKSVLDYLEDGYLKEAIINFLAFLGWSPKGNREMYSLEELSKDFSLSRINKNSAVFNIEKLNWFNSEWLKQLSALEFNNRIQEAYPNNFDSKITESIAALVKSRIHTIKEFPNIAGPFYKDPELDNSILDSVPLAKEKIIEFSKKILSIKNWSPENIKEAVVAFADENNLETKDLYRTLGVATFGSLVTPPLPDAVAIIGKEKTKKRLEVLAEKKK